MKRKNIPSARPRLVIDWWCVCARRRKLNQAHAEKQVADCPTPLGQQMMHGLMRGIFF
jgi:hypothetical protein